MPHFSGSLMPIFSKASIVSVVALPTAISAETIYLTCTFTESKAVPYAAPLKSGWDWKPTVNNVYEFTVNTNTNSGTLYEVNFNELHKFNDVFKSCS